MAITVDVSRKSALKKVVASAELPPLWVPALLPVQTLLTILAPSGKLHWLKYAINASWHCCWQTTAGFWFGNESSDKHSRGTPAKMLLTSSSVHVWRLLMDLIFRLCCVLRVSWSAGKVTLCWQWPPWINNVVKTTMITAAFIIRNQLNTTQSVWINWPQLRSLLNKCHLICLINPQTPLFLFFLFLNCFTF